MPFVLVYDNPSGGFVLFRSYFHLFSVCSLRHQLTVGLFLLMRAVIVRIMSVNLSDIVLL